MQSNIKTISNFHHVNKQYRIIRQSVWRITFVYYLRGLKSYGGLVKITFFPEKGGGGGGVLLEIEVDENICKWLTTTIYKHFPRNPDGK